MKASTLTVYPTYNTQPIEISDRSALYSLEPQGLRTALVESLTSYIQRLALAHCVQPGILITKMCIPLIEGNSNETPSISFGSRASRAFNGTGSIALKTVNIIQTLTARSDLSSLTLLPFAQAIPLLGVFRLVEAWCPICLSEWRDADHEIYTPLLWAFTDIKVCLRHSCLLHEKCQHCGKSWNLLGWRSRPGYCSKCAQWLGQANSVELESGAFYSEADQSFNAWAATHIGKLLASQGITSSCTQEKIISSFTQCIDVLTEGNRQAFSRLVNKNPDVIARWHLGIKAPSLRPIMEICHYLNLSLVDFLTGNLNESLIQASRKFSSKANSIEEDLAYKEEKVE